MSETHYDWRKIEPVTMKANFIQFWCEESEFMIKNKFHNWTSELGCIWHIFGKIWLFSSTSALATTSCCKKTEPCWQWCWKLLEYPDLPKRAKNSLIFQKCAIWTQTLMSNYEINFWFWFQIPHIKNQWNMPSLYGSTSLSLALFFFNHNEFRTGWAQLEK